MYGSHLSKAVRDRLSRIPSLYAGWPEMQDGDEWVVDTREDSGATPYGPYAPGIGHEACGQLNDYVERSTHDRPFVTFTIHGNLILPIRL